MAANKRTCFGFFSGEDNCQRCAAARKCKAVLVTHGFDVAEGVLEEVLATLPEGSYTIDVDEINADNVPGASDALKVRARDEAEKLYKQIVYGAPQPATGSGAIPTDLIQPDDL